MQQQEPTKLEKYAQVVSREMRDALKRAAEKRGISLDMEIALRLTAIQAEPEFDSDHSILSRIMRHEFTDAELEAECKRKREGNLAVYEIEKLGRLLRVKDSLPRAYKENFTVIDTKYWTQIIQAEIDAENKNKPTDEDDRWL